MRKPNLHLTLVRQIAEAVFPCQQLFQLGME